MAKLVPAAARTMTLFEVFAREKKALSNSELARLLELPESSCSDLVQTLIHCGFLMRMVKSRRLYPTGRLLSVASDISRNDTLLATMLEACELLRDKTGESALCGRVEEGVVKVITVCDGHHPVRYAAAGGDKLSLHVSALGKAILACHTPEEAVRQLRLKQPRKLASGTITDLAKLEKQIAGFREKGWAWVENEGGEDLAALAVAGTIDGEHLALSVAGPIGRLRLNYEDYLAALKSVQALFFENS